tara:strand:- start:534 stop:749 length:216 start_codon:yes stop_codon:yes gene_type:complete
MDKIISAITSIDSLTIYGVNLAAFIVSLTNIGDIARLILLLASIIFTVVKTADIIRNWKKEDKKDGDNNKL